MIIIMIFFKNKIQDITLFSQKNLETMNEKRSELSKIKAYTDNNKKK